MSAILLAGYFGAGNLGDDAILAGFSRPLEDAGYDVIALSGSPEDTYRQHRVSSYHRRESRQIDQAFARASALVFPGGSIFQDVTSVRSVLYYQQLVARAKKKGIPVVMVGQGVGPLKSMLGKRWAREAFEAADAIAVRDPASMQALRDLGVKRPVRVTADTAFLLDTGLEEAGSSFQVGGLRSVAVAPRPLAGKTDVVGLIGDFCRMVFQSGSAIPTLVAMDRHEDAPLIQEISNRVGGKIPDLRRIDSPVEVQRRLARMDVVVAMRLHAGILASNVGVPPLMISYDPKVTAFARLLDVGPALSVEGLTPARLFDAYTSFVKDRERNAKIVGRKREEMAKAAQENVAVALEVFKQRGLPRAS